MLWNIIITMTLTVIVIDLVMRFMRFIVFCFAVRVCGWRPKIFDMKLAVSEAKSCTQDFFDSLKDENTAISKGLVEDERELWRARMEVYSVWVIERYTVMLAGEKPSVRHLPTPKHAA